MCHPEWSKTAKRLAESNPTGARRSLGVYKRPTCHPERKNAKRFGVEVLRRRSKTKERSDEGVHEGEPIAFLRKVTSLERRYQESLEDPNAAPLPTVPTGKALRNTCAPWEQRSNKTAKRRPDSPRDGVIFYYKFRSPNSFLTRLTSSRDT